MATLIACVQMDQLPVLKSVNDRLLCNALTCNEATLCRLVKHTRRSGTCVSCRLGVRCVSNPSATVIVRMHAILYLLNVAGVVCRNFS